jgi:hypothetical protein
LACTRDIPRAGPAAVDRIQHEIVAAATIRRLQENTIPVIMSYARRYREEKLC